MTELIIDLTTLKVYAVERESGWYWFARFHDERKTGAMFSLEENCDPFYTREDAKEDAKIWYRESFDLWLAEERKAFVAKVS